MTKRVAYVVSKESIRVADTLPVNAGRVRIKICCKISTHVTAKKIKPSKRVDFYLLPISYLLFSYLLKNDFNICVSSNFGYSHH